MKLKILLTLITLLSANSTLAHHSFSAEFDIDKPVSLSGKVTKMQWSNPHGWIYIDVENADGSMTNWALETSAANNLIRRGWKRDHLVAGTVIQVQGFQARNGSCYGKHPRHRAGRWHASVFRQCG